MPILISASANMMARSMHRGILLAVTRSAFSRFRDHSYGAWTHAHKSRSSSTFGPIGVQAALRYATDPSFRPRPTVLQEEFSLAGRVAVVSGGQRGLGLEMAEALAEAGATVYCLDRPIKPDKTFELTQAYVSKLQLAAGARLEYESVDVTYQKDVWNLVGKIADKEGRLDVCVAAAGILIGDECLDHSAKDFQKVMEVNVYGAFYTAQAAGRQMTKFGTPGSIVLIASMSGNLTNRGQHAVAYNTSKSAVVQMGRSMACELGAKAIRVNTISPGYMGTTMLNYYLKENPSLLEQWSDENPLKRIGRPDELRGVVIWLASDASSFCTGSDIMVTGGHHSW